MQLEIAGHFVMRAIKLLLVFYVDGDQLVALTIYHNYCNRMNGQGGFRIGRFSFLSPRGTRSVFECKAKHVKGRLYVHSLEVNRGMAGESGPLPPPVTAITLTNGDQSAQVTQRGAG